jgi:hypothetical protein
MCRYILIVGAVCAPKMFENLYQTTWYYHSEDRQMNLRTIWKLQTLHSKSANFSHKFRSNLKILGSRRVTWSEFHSQDPQILGATLQNIVAMAVLGPAFVHTSYILTPLSELKQSPKMQWLLWISARQQIIIFRPKNRGMEARTWVILISPVVHVRKLWLSLSRMTSSVWS